MAGIDQNPTELEQPHGHENQPDDEQKNEHEYQPDNEQEYQPVNENENENEDELAHDFAHVEEQEEHKPEPEDVMTENFQYDEEQDILNEDAQESVDGGGERWPGWPGECVFRMLVPLQKVGRIIGRKGEYIRKTCEETKARIKIIHGPRGTRERVVMVSAKEEPNASLPPAIDCLLRVHKRVVDGLDDDSSHPPSGLGGKVSTRLLVPAAQTGSLIGKQGTTVKLIQEESNCVVRILGTEELPVFTLQDDRIVEVVGEPAGVHKAIELIASQLRKFLVDRSIISLIEMQMQRPFSSLTEPVPPADPWLQPPPPFPPIEPAGPGYAPNSHYMPPPRQFSNYYHPVEMPPPPEKQPHQGISVYGREAPTHSSSSQPAPSVITQVAQRMKIPLSYADAVIGTQGATISYIRRVSGATVTIQEARGVPGEMTIEISGTASQAQTAQLLIQDFMADAPAGPQAQYALLADHNAYAAHGLGYPPQQPPNPSLSGQSGNSGSNHGY